MTNQNGSHRNIEVPLADEQLLEVEISQLPENPRELTYIFEQEGVVLQYYRLLAIEYERQGKLDEAIIILKAGLNAGPPTNANVKRYEQPRARLPLLVLLATLHIKKFRGQAGGSDKTAAIQAIAECDRINKAYEPIFAVKGLLYFQEGKWDEAKRHFKMTIERQPNCLPALLGLARMACYERKWVEALRLHQEALRYAPMGGPEVRLGIGLCFHRLGMEDQAKRAFERCLEVDPANSTALVLLAIMKFNEVKCAEGDEVKSRALQEGSNHLSAAFKINKNHPVVLNALANLFFFQRKFSQTISTATKAFNLGDTSSIKAEACYQLGRAHHQMQQFEEAHNFYEKAANIKADHVLARYGLGQIQIQRSEIDKAIETFEYVLSKEPNSLETLKMLGVLYAHKGNKDKANDIFDKVLATVGEYGYLEGEVYADIAMLNEMDDSDKASRAYARAMNAWMADEERVKPEIYNNFAALRHLEGDLEQAEIYYKKALTECEELMKDVDTTESEKTRLRDLEITIMYNMGRLKEQALNLTDATVIFRKIVEQYPGYIDAHLRLGAMEQLLGHYNEAQEHYKDVFEADAHNATAWTMFAQSQLERNETKSAKKTLERVLKECDKNDIYALTLLGNYHLIVGREAKGSDGDQVNLRKQSYRLAQEFFRKVLLIDPTNIFGANGLSILIAEQGEYKDAHDMFLSVRESSGSVGSVQVNEAHCKVELGQWEKAIVLYEKIGHKFYEDKDWNLMLCIGRAYYLWGRMERNPKALLGALKFTQKAYHLDPKDKSILYDIALVYQSYAQVINDKAKEERSLKELARSLEFLHAAKRIWECLIQVQPGEHVGYDPKLAEQRSKFGLSLTRQVEGQLAEQEGYEKSRLERIEEARLKREELGREKERVRLEIEQKKLEELERVEEQRRTTMERIQEENERDRELVRSDDDGEDRRKPKKKRRDQKRREEEDEEEPEDDGMESGSDKRKRRRKDGGERLSRSKKGGRKGKRAGSDDGRDESGRGGKTFKSTEMVVSEDDEDMDFDMADEEKTVRRRLVKSRSTVDDSSDIEGEVPDSDISEQEHGTSPMKDTIKVRSSYTDDVPVRSGAAAILKDTEEDVEADENVVTSSSKRVRAIIDSDEE